MKSVRTTAGWALGIAALLLACPPAAQAWHWPHWPRWPWRGAPAAAPQPVQAVRLSVGQGGTILQYWDRNALLLDLTGVGGDGVATLQPIAGWPVRLEFRVQPGRIAHLTVEAAQRVVYEVPTGGSPLLLQLAPDAYRSDTAAITLRWSAADDSAR